MSDLWRVRIEASKRLLAETGLTSEKIAYRCGFQSPYHFSRKFKELVRVGPREFRVQCWED